MDKKTELIKNLNKTTDLQQYLFVRGFLLTDYDITDLDVFPFYGNWHKEKVGAYYALTHNKLKLHYVKKGDEYYILFGHAYSPFMMEYNEEIILERIAASDMDGIQQIVDELTGIFVFCIIRENKIYFQTDAAGIQSACYGIVNKHFFLSSHAQLVGDICGLKIGDLQNELIHYKWYYRVMGPYLPADMEPFDELKRVVPDIEYIYDGALVTKKRFYPLKTIHVCQTDEEYMSVIRKGADILKRNFDLVVKKWQNPAISLTGGIDSNTTFAAANGHYDEISTFSYLSAKKETIDVDAAKLIADHFRCKWKLYEIPEDSGQIENFELIKSIIDHNNAYIAEGVDNEYRKRAYLMTHLDCDVEVKSWVSETIRAYWYKHYGRKSMPSLSPKLFRNLYKIFLLNRKLAHKIDRVFEQYIDEFEYHKIPDCYPPADMHFNEVTWGSWGSLNISEMKIYSDITIIYNNRTFLDLMFRVPLEKRISDQLHLDMKKILNKELYDMNIRVVNMKETATRARLLNIIFTINSILPF